MLKEQDIIRNELLTRLEKEQERVSSEVSKLIREVTTLLVQLQFYKDQNSDLIKRLDEFETSCFFDAGDASVIVKMSNFSNES